MTKYLNTKPGSVEEVVANMNKTLRQDGAYQDMFKKELDKAGKGIGAMSPKEKKDFFNKIDSKYKAKDEGFASDAQRKAAFASGYKAKDKKEDLNNKDASVVNKVKDMLKGASAKHAAQAKMLDKAMKTEAEMPAGPDVDQMHKVKKAKSKDPEAGEKEPMKMNKESLERTLWKMAGDQLEEMKKKVQMKAQDVAPDSDTDSEKDEKKGKTLIGSKQTKVETEPKVDYVK